MVVVWLLGTVLKNIMKNDLKNLNMRDELKILKPLKKLMLQYWSFKKENVADESWEDTEIIVRPKFP